MRHAPSILAVLTACASLACGGDDDSPDDSPDAALAADAGPGADAEVAACDSPLDDDIIAQLTTSIEPTLAVRPGGSIQMRLGTVECCYTFEVVTTSCVRWSVSPAGEGATIDELSGLLRVADDVQHGTVFTVTADVESGRKRIDVGVHVYTPEGNPLIGYWVEQAQLSCIDDGEVTPSQTIYELAFRADGRFGVTWTPFELYVDYWGDYDFDVASGTISLTVTGGNYVPPDVEGVGRFRFDGSGDLVLEDLWLGSPQGGGAHNCGHRFSR